MSLKLALVDLFHAQSLDVIQKALPPGWQLQVTDDATEEARRAVLKDADAAFVMAAPLPRSVLRVAPHLTFVHKLGAGIDRIDSAYCAEAGIGLARLNAGNAIPTAEHTLLLMLAACRGLRSLDQGVRAGKWEKERARGTGRQINGRTIGIIGFGAVGQQVARLLAPFGATVRYYSRTRAPTEVELALDVAFMELDDLLASSDIVTLHVPLQHDTKNLIDAKRLRRMKSGAILINTGRGAVIDEAALAQALQDEDLLAAGLDVFAQEPPSESPLLNAPHTMLTPHVGGATIDNFHGVVGRAVDNLQRALDARPIGPKELIVPVNRCWRVHDALVHKT